VQVPDVSGKSEQDAVQALQTAGLTVAPNRAQDDNPNFPAGQVTKTDPPAGQTVSEGQAITLTVSTGNVQVPDVTGKTQDQATAALGQATLTVVVNQVVNSATPGTVLDQNPAANSLVRQHSQVTIDVAKAAPTVTVPTGITGLSYDQAVSKLNQAGITNIQKVVEVSAAPKDQVIRVDPAEGTEIPQGDPVELHVSDGSNGSTGGTGKNTGSTQSPSPSADSPAGT
jgi:serine/threonine-protein kinase